jgi:hypothetical protein
VLVSGVCRFPWLFVNCELKIIFIVHKWTHTQQKHNGKIYTCALWICRLIAIRPAGTYTVGVVKGRTTTGAWYRAELIRLQHPRGWSLKAKMAEGMETSSTGASGVRDDIGLAMSERPTCILCLGMAGSGKTTFVQVKSWPLAGGTGIRILLRHVRNGLQPDEYSLFHTCRD